MIIATLLCVSLCFVRKLSLYCTTKIFTHYSNCRNGSLAYRTAKRGAAASQSYMSYSVKAAFVRQLFVSVLRRISRLKYDHMRIFLAPVTKLLAYHRRAYYRSACASAYSYHSEEIFKTCFH